MDKTREIYFSFDIESDGPVPGLNSMLSLGAAVLAWDTVKHEWRCTATFSINIEPLPDTHPDKDTTDFWLENPEAFAATKVNQVSAGVAMERFAAWVQTCKQADSRKLVAVGSPAAFDYPFIRYYMLRFIRTDKPFGHSCIDTKSVASTILKIPYTESGKRNYPQSWFCDSFKHTHVAVEDAIEQGFMFARMLDGLNGK